VHSRRKNKTVRQALTGSSWVRDLGRALPAHLLHDYIDLWRLLQGTVLRNDVPDSITWALSDNHELLQNTSSLPSCYCTTGSGAQIACSVDSGRTSISASFA
jgi:hypothetical protein